MTLRLVGRVDSSKAGRVIISENTLMKKKNLFHPCQKPWFAEMIWLILQSSTGIGEKQKDAGCGETWKDKQHAQHWAAISNTVLVEQGCRMMHSASTERERATPCMSRDVGELF